MYRNWGKKINLHIRNKKKSKFKREKTYNPDKNYEVQNLFDMWIRLSCFVYTSERVLFLCALVVWELLLSVCVQESLK